MINDSLFTICLRVALWHECLFGDANLRDAESRADVRQLRNKLRTMDMRAKDVITELRSILHGTEAIA